MQMAMNQREAYGISHPGNRELNDLLKKVEKKSESDATKLNRMYTEMMRNEEAEPEQKYISRRRRITGNLKSKNYWPDGMKHPD